MATVRFSASAANDLLEAWLYVAEDSITAADRILDQIDAEARNLLDQPLIGRARDELAQGMRALKRRSRHQFGNDFGRLIEILPQFSFAVVADHLCSQIPGFLFSRRVDLTQIAGTDADVVDRHVRTPRWLGLLGASRELDIISRAGVDGALSAAQAIDTPKP